MRAITCLVVGLLGLAGCGKAHISAGFGKANREAMSMQTPPLPTSPVPMQAGLDTQEAGVIGDGYLRSLAGKNKTSAEPDPILYVAPATRQGNPQIPPSVPKS